MYYYPTSSINISKDCIVIDLSIISVDKEINLNFKEQFHFLKLKFSNFKPFFLRVDSYVKMYTKNKSCPHYRKFSFLIFAHQLRIFHNLTTHWHLTKCRWKTRNQGSFKVTTLTNKRMSQYLLEYQRSLNIKAYHTMLNNFDIKCTERLIFSQSSCLENWFLKPSSKNWH